MIFIFSSVIIVLREKMNRKGRVKFFDSRLGCRENLARIGCGARVQYGRRGSVESSYFKLDFLENGVTKGKNVALPFRLVFARGVACRFALSPIMSCILYLLCFNVSNGSARYHFSPLRALMPK